MWSSGYLLESRNERYQEQYQYTVYGIKVPFVRAMVQGISSRGWVHMLDLSVEKWPCAAEACPRIHRGLRVLPWRESSSNKISRPVSFVIS